MLIFHILEALPEPTEEYNAQSNTKVITEYKINDEGHKVKASIFFYLHCCRSLNSKNYCKDFIKRQIFDYEK